MLLFLVGGVFCSGLVVWGYREFDRDLPDRWGELTDYKPSRASRVFSAEGELIGEFFLQKRIVLPYDKIPLHVAQAFVAAEDNRFFEHKGVDPLGILRAAFANVKAGRVVQGGSTITQQVAKLMLVGSERNLFRKIREAMLANKIERRLKKEQILAIYLNHAYLGHGAYGVQAASEIYFGKDVKDLSVAEAAMLGGLPKAPSEDSPFVNYNRARDRQRYVLSQMLENKFIDKKTYDQAYYEPIAIISRDTPLNHIAAPYFVEYIRRLVQAKYGGRDLYDRGLRIYTTLSMPQQRAAEIAVKRGLDDIDRRFAFRGPVGELAPEQHEKFYAGMPTLYLGDKAPMVQSPLTLGRPFLATLEKVGKKSYAKIGPIKVAFDEYDVGRIEHWSAHKGNKMTATSLVPVRVVKVETKKGSGKKEYTEIIEVAQLAQRPEVQSALVAVDVHTGKLTAMVGGYDYSTSQFNRATQAKRQAGSSIKPYLYATALDNGYTETTIVYDSPVKVKTASGWWSPHNYKAEYLGPITLRTALQKSINTVAVRMVAGIGVDKMIEGIRRFGITAPIVRHPSIALGTPEVTLIEHTYGYATFPSGGLEIKPIVIDKILDADGNVIEENKPQPFRRRIPADLAYVMVDMMKNVIEKGTGQKARELGRPAGGKTGTSNEFRDNWFMAYTRDVVCGVWVGRDDFKPIGHEATGGNTAAPIWTDFLRQAHPPTPISDFPVPTDIYFVRVSPDKGGLQKPGTPGSMLLPFRRGTVPTALAKASKADASANFADEIF